MENKSIRVNLFLTALLFLSFTGTVWADDITGSVFTGQAKSSKSGTTWPAILRITAYDQVSGNIIGEIEWTSLGSVHKIVGQLNGSQLTFREVEYIKKGGATLNGEYTSTYNYGEITGTWKDPSPDYGTFQMKRQTDHSPVVQNSDFKGSVFTGQAKSSKSGTTWPALLRITAYDQVSGNVIGEIEWTSLGSVHKIVGQLNGSQFTFKEVEYIKQGGANLNGEYTSTYSIGEISGTWKDPSSDYGTFQMKRQTDHSPVVQNSDFKGSIFTGQAKSSKSGTTWPAILRITAYDQASGKVVGEIEWTSLGSVHKIVGQLNGSQFTFKEVEYIKQGGATLNGEYISTYNNDEISGTWKDPSSDFGTFRLNKK